MVSPPLRCASPVIRYARRGLPTRAPRVGVPGFVPESRPAQANREVRAGRRGVDPEIAASVPVLDCLLTERESDVLWPAREGLSVRETAGRAHPAGGTVRDYLSSAMTEVGEPSRGRPARRGALRGGTWSVVGG
ncbi:hypothetical protein [Embleya sp. AB8]|uniref:hypothetical protein n=1 Tax=Embleya sp. AB8 TaxID=3156304 RepID=UPI003C72927F